MKRWKWTIALMVFLLLMLGCEPVKPNNDKVATEEISDDSPTEESIRVSRVVDGDTVELSDGRKVRYLGINTPERGQPFYEEASQFNVTLVADEVVRLEYDVDTIDKYGRTLAHIFVGDTHVNLELVRQGYANVYTVPPNVKYSKEFLAAEREAREQQRGLWAQSSAPIRITDLDPIDEWIELANQDDQPIDLTGYTLKDEANHIYEFGDFTLKGDQTVRLYTESGQSTSTKLYWGMGNDKVWNNNGDTAYLRDPDGSLVDLYTY